jgi:predicted esterase
MKVIKILLDYQNQKTNALVFLPEIEADGPSEISSTFAVFTHGYTSDKSSILNWPIRLAEAGIACILFDLPGHYLGNFSEVEDFEYFKQHGHELFYSAYISLKNTFINEFPLYEHFFESGQLKLVLGGHSLGAMLSLKALMLPEFKDFTKLSISVGLGMAPKDIVHIFDTPFYKSTLKIREQLVSPALKPTNVFPWIKEEKLNLNIQGAMIHLITGEDDLVVGNDGMERFAESLLAKNNQVTMEKPSKLPHHEPQLAAGYVKKYLKKINWL